MGEFLFVLLFIGGIGCWGMYYIVKMWRLLIRWDLAEVKEEEEDLLRENEFLRDKIKSLGA